jgi:hypothetical protein
MEASPKFAAWMAEHGFDQQHWTEEMRRSLQERFRRENPPKILVDCRGADWPQRTFRVEPKL